MFRLSRVLPLLAVALIFASCVDSPEQPQPTAFGTYRLESIGGLPVTTPNTAPVEGGLLLRANGTFEFIVRGTNGAVFTGTYDALNGALVVFADSSSFYPKSTQGIGRVMGDSIRLRIAIFSFYTQTVSSDSSTWILRKVAMDEVPVKEGTYVLKTLNDKPSPFITDVQTNGGIRYVSQIDFDTLIFRDGFFYQESRSESTTSEGGGGSGSSFRLTGMYGGNNTVIRLRAGYQPFAFPQQTAAEHDSLYVNGAALMRRFVTSTTIFQERYERVK